jgi:hypothetical protein
MAMTTSKEVGGEPSMAFEPAFPEGGVLAQLWSKARPARPGGSFIDDLRGHLAQFCALLQERLVADPAALPDDLRNAGLTVAMHTDLAYGMGGERMSFWMMVRDDGMSFKGQGATDAEALNQIRVAVAPKKRGRKKQ